MSNRKRLIPNVSGYINKQGLACVSVRFEEGKELHTIQCKCGELYELPFRNAWFSGGCAKCRAIIQQNRVKLYSSKRKKKEVDEMDNESLSVPSTMELTRRIMMNYAQNRAEHMKELDEIGWSRL